MFQNIRSILVGIGVIITAWVAFYFSNMFSSLILPSPIGTFDTLFQLLVSGRVNYDILITVYRWIVGFALGIIVGVPLGLLLELLVRLF